MLGLRTTIYRVPDLAQAKSWYTQAFSKAPYFDEPFYVGYNIGGFELGLMPQENAPLATADNIMSYWGMEDIQATYDHLLSLQATPHEAPYNVGGPLMVASVRDPWGNVIGLIYNPHFPNQEG
ncbi:MAG: VOC family protein [Bacteroidota bacterium]